MRKVILIAIAAALLAGCAAQPAYYSVPVYYDVPVYNYVSVPTYYSVPVYYDEPAGPAYTYTVKTSSKGKTTTSWSVKW
jgi:hypothetical protein